MCRIKFFTIKLDDFCPFMFKIFYFWTTFQCGKTKKLHWNLLLHKLIYLSVVVAQFGKFITNLDLGGMNELQILDEFDLLHIVLTFVLEEATHVAKQTHDHFVEHFWLK